MKTCLACSSPFIIQPIPDGQVVNIALLYSYIAKTNANWQKLSSARKAQFLDLFKSKTPPNFIVLKNIIRNTLKRRQFKVFRTTKESRQWSCRWSSNISHPRDLFRNDSRRNFNWSPLTRCRRVRVRRNDCTLLVVSWCRVLWWKVKGKQTIRRFLC